MKKIVFITLITFGSLFEGFGQTNDFGSVSIPTPNVATFTKFIDNPINTFNGSADVSIPVYTIKNGDIEIPIVLRYNTNGIKVSEEAGHVGLGWNLNVGGIITHNIVGELDTDSEFDNLEGYHRNNPDNPLYPEYPLPTLGFMTYSYWQGLYNVHPCLNAGENLNSEIDGKVSYGKGQPDIYNYSFLNHAGKFFIDYRDDQIHMMDIKEDIQFEKIISEENSHVGWIAVTPDGNKFYFTESEHMFSELGHNLISKTFNLTQIAYTSGKKVFFEYESCGLASSFKNLNETYFWDCSCSGISNYQYTPTISTNYYEVVTLKRIYSNDLSEEVIFYYSEREDILAYNVLANSSKDKKLDSIEVKDKLGNLKFGFSFNYNNFISPTDGNVWEDGNTEVRRKRLRLNSFGQNGLPNYEFKYSDIQLPSKQSFAQDYWGYYNGRTENESLLANFWSIYHFKEKPSADILPNEIISRGDIRACNIDFIEAGALKKITYPTGGTMEIEYESNSFKNQFYPSIAQIQEISEIKAAQNISQTRAAYIETFETEGSTPDYKAFFFDIEKTSTIKLKCTFSWPCKFTANYQAIPDWLEMQGAYFKLSKRNLTYNNPIEDVIGPIYVAYQQDGSYTYSIEIEQELEPGNYGIYPSIPNSTNGNRRTVAVDVSVIPNEYVFPEGFSDLAFGAGIRVKSITNSTSDGSSIKTCYDYGNGILMSPLQFYYSWTYEKAPAENGKLYVTKSSSGHRPLSHAAMGGMVGYENVTLHMEQLGSPNDQYPNGSIQYTYHVEPPWTKPGNPEIPNLRNGKVESETHFDKNGSLVLKKSFLYEIHENHRYYGFKSPLDRRAGRCDIYPLISSRINLSHISETQFMSQGQINSYSEFSYDYKNQLKSKITTINNEKIVEKYKYPYDIIEVEECENQRSLRYDENFQKEKDCFDATKLYEIDYLECKNIKGSAYGNCMEEYSDLLEDYYECRENNEWNPCWIKYNKQYKKASECQQLRLEYYYDCDPTLNEYYTNCIASSDLMSELEINDEFEGCISDKIHLFDPDLTIYRKMEEANFITPIVETQKWKIDVSGSSKLISSEAIIYDDFSGGSSMSIFRPSKTYNMEFPNSLPIGEGNFIELSILEINENYSLQFDENYKLNANFTFNNNGNLIQVDRSNNIKSSYFWAYNNSFPVVKAENVEYDVLGTNNDLFGAVLNAPRGISGTIEEFFNSFNNSGGFFNANGTFNTANKSKWEIFHTSVRNALPNALISFYTYDPLIGMTSQTDPNGKTTYYEYDDIGRLEYIKDDEGKVLQRYEYNYAK